MTVSRPLPYLLALLLGVAASVLVACGQDRSNLIPAGDAQALHSRLDAVKSALDSGDCTEISSLVADAKSEAAKLPASVDRRLRQRINEGIRTLESEAPRQCTTPQTQTETIPTVTTPAPDTQTATTTTPTETVTTPDTTVTDTTPVPPADTTTSTDQTPAPDSGTGGAAPGATDGTTP
jgi:hypothetical protein